MFRTGRPAPSCCTALTIGATAAVGSAARTTRFNCAYDRTPYVIQTCGRPASRGLRAWTCATTPTTSVHCGLATAFTIRRRCPIADSVGHNSRARRSSTITTRSIVVAACEVAPGDQRDVERLEVAGQSDEAVDLALTHRWPERNALGHGGAGERNRISRTDGVNAREFTHVIRQLFVEHLPLRPRLLDGADVESLVAERDAASSPPDAASNPSGTDRRLTNARAINPAPTSRTTDSASCAATSIPRVRPARAGSLVSRALIRDRVACHAGTRLTMTAHTKASAVAKTATPPSTAMDSRRGSAAGASARSAETPQCASIHPPAAPMVPTTSPSTTSCRMMSRRPAPSAMRTAISRARAEARASSRLVRFAHATMSTSATAPAAATSAGFAPLTTSASIGCERQPDRTGAIAARMLGGEIPGDRVDGCARRRDPHAAPHPRDDDVAPETGHRHSRRNGNRADPPAATT